MDSLTVTDQASAAVATHPRVTLRDIETAIGRVYYGDASTITNDTSDGILTICIVKMKNGFITIGKSAPASPENFNRDLGRRYAYEDAIRQLWPLMGFALRDKLASQS